MKKLVLAILLLGSAAFADGPVQIDKRFTQPPHNFSPYTVELIQHHVHEYCYTAELAGYNLVVTKVETTPYQWDQRVDYLHRIEIAVMDHGRRRDTITLTVEELAGRFDNGNPSVKEYRYPSFICYQI